MERENGFYWIRVSAGEQTPQPTLVDWEVAQFEDNTWSLCGSEVYINETKDEGFGRVAEIGPKLEAPPALKLCTCGCNLVITA